MGKNSYSRNKDRNCLTLKIVKGFNENFKLEGLSDEVAMKNQGLSPADVELGW
jgi:hypothetical protein